jgi:hypothetical protein
MDLFGVPIQFNFDGEEYYKSIIGGISTLLMFAIIIFICSVIIIKF